MSRRKRLFCVLLWAAALGWMAMIFWFSAKDGTASGDMSGGLIRFFAVRVSPGFSRLDAAEQAAVVESWQFAVRKLAHFSEYAVLGGLYAAAIRLSLNGRSGRGAAALRTGLPLLLGLAYAAGDEWHQAFVPGRGPAVRDVLIDFAGVLAGTLLGLAAAALYRRRRR